MTEKKTNSSKSDVPSPFQTVLPKGIKAGRDKLMMSLHIYHEAIVLQDVERKAGTFRFVSAQDIATALNKNLTFSSGILPENTLWWSNSKGGQLVAIWVEPGVRRLAVKEDAMKTAKRYNVPLPGLIFLCRPGLSPWIYAALKRPEAPRDIIYHAPLANVYEDGRICGGSVKWPQDMGKIPEAFLTSFFTRHLGTRSSKKYPNDITKQWAAVDGKKEWPASDLVARGTLQDLLTMRI